MNWGKELIGQNSSVFKCTNKDYTNLIHILWDIGQDPKSESATKGLLSFCQLCTYQNSCHYNLFRINPPIERALFKITEVKDGYSYTISRAEKIIYPPKKWNSTEWPKYVTTELWRI